MKYKQLPTDTWREKLLEGSEELVDNWLIASPVPVFLAKTRRSKHGDFRVPRTGKQAYITINHDLHPVEFLVTLAHEIAHYRNWIRYGRRVKPHGQEWRNEFRALLAEVLKAEILEKEIAAEVVQHYFKRALIGSGTSEQLNRLLGKTQENSNVLHVSDLPEGACFTLRSGKTFIKGKKLRKRYQCCDAFSSRIYTVHPMAEVKETLVS
ncbi:MAG: SprT-like domain-containing protein [Bacteroidales bacterium]|nr:SprT-like domain-containing protein [Bacteroidales bacterium]